MPTQDVHTPKACSEFVRRNRGGAEDVEALGVHLSFSLDACPYSTLTTDQEPSGDSTDRDREHDHGEEYV
mgnify:CR=1 FL=1